MRSWIRERIRDKRSCSNFGISGLISLCIPFEVGRKEALVDVPCNLAREPNSDVVFRFR